MRAVEELYDPAKSPLALVDSQLSSLQDIGLLISSEIASGEIRDLAFFARNELRSALDNLLAAADREHMAPIASHCEGGLRRLRKALVSIESAIYEYEGLEPPPEILVDLDVSLQTRQLFASLRREVARRRAETAPLEERLRAVAHRLVALRELRIYPFLRFDDRVQLRQLLGRILDWLNSDDRSTAAGRAVWEDLENFAGLLTQVNHRQELRQHDRTIVQRAHRALFRGPSCPEEVPADVLTELWELVGLDDALDELILNRRVRPASSWRPALERLRRSFQVSEGGLAQGLVLG